MSEMKEKLNKINIKDILYAGIVGWSIGIWLFIYIPTVVFAKDNQVFYFSRHLFYYLQILMNVSGFALFYVMFKNKLSWKVLGLFFAIGTIITYLRVFNNLHDFMKETNLYLDIFKTSPDGKTVVSFQYARIMMLAIIMIFGITSFIYLRKTFLKVFVFFFIIAFYIFFYFMHAYIGKELYLQASANLVQQIKIVAINYKHADKLCKDLDYNCSIVENTKDYTLSKVDIENRIVSQYSTREEANEIITKYMKDFINSGEDLKVYDESAFQTNNLRAVSFAFKKVDDKHTFVLQDSKNLSHILDLYLIYFSIAFNMFLLIWGSGVYWLYKKHSKMRVEKLEQAININ